MKEINYELTHKSEKLYEGDYKNKHFVVSYNGNFPCCYVQYNGEFDGVDVKPQDYHLAPNIDLFTHYKNNIAFNDCPSHCGINYLDKGLPFDHNEERYYIGWEYGHIGDYQAINEGLKTCGRDKKWTVKEIVEEAKKAIDYLNKLQEKRFTEKSLSDKNQEALKVIYEVFKCIKEKKEVSAELIKKFRDTYKTFKGLIEINDVFKKYSVAYLNDVEREDEDKDIEDTYENIFDSYLFSGIDFKDVRDPSDLIILDQWLQNEGLYR